MFIVINGDQCTFDSVAGTASITMSPTTITGTGLTDNLGNNLCIDGDEKSVTQTGSYINGAYVGGTVVATIDSLIDAQLSKHVSSNGKAVILCTGKYKVKFTVTIPAVNPSGPQSDLNTSYMGTGSFITANTLVESQ